jgi:tyrosyl-tRNA synthetase
MEDLKKYLDERLEQTKESCEKWLNHQRQGLQSALNQEMLNQIAYAEQQIEIGKNRAVEQFKNSMSDLQKRKSESGSELMQRAYTLMEKSIKHSFEVSLKSTERMWKNHIEHCRLNMK